MNTPSRTAANVDRAWQTCEIRWWRGYVKSDFYAAIIDSEGREDVVARSKRFRWRSSDPPPKENKDVSTALEAFSAQLVDTGWRPAPMDAAAAWYAWRFKRLSLGGSGETRLPLNYAPGRGSVQIAQQPPGARRASPRWRWRLIGLAAVSLVFLATVVVIVSGILILVLIALGTWGT